MMKIKKILSNAWTISIISPIIVTIIISISTAIIKQINVLEAFGLFLEFIKTSLVTIITYRIPVYSIALVVLFLIVVITIYIKVYDMKQDNLPKWLSYTTTRYQNWIFKWEYSSGYDNKYSVKNLRPICKCGCELSLKYDYKGYNPYGILVCPNCEHTYPNIDSSTDEDLLKVITHNINTSNFPHN